MSLDINMTKYNHDQNIHFSAILREVVFGMEDGMVSSLGAITGIAIGSQDHSTVFLAGAVIIAVESISMGIGSYLSHRSGQEVNARKLVEEKIELAEFPKEEKEELFNMFMRDGWPKDLSRQMADEASRDKELMLKEMAYRELKISIGTPVSSLNLGLFMFVSYIFGGIIPLFAYFVLPISSAIKVSIVITLVGLFGLGAITTRYTQSLWLKSGLRVLLLGGIALLVGFWVGKLVVLFQ